MAEVNVAEFMVDATKDFIVQLLNEKSLIDALVQPRIQQLIAAGDVVPRSRLQLGVGLELGPVGLEQAARALVAATDGVEIPEIEGFTTALTTLIAVLERVDAPAIPESITTEIDDEDSEPEVEAPHCEVCDVVVTDEQRLTSWTRWRHVLCKDHHSSYDPKKPLAKPAPKKKAS